jgi:hypothetical protein
MLQSESTVCAEADLLVVSTLRQLTTHSNSITKLIANSAQELGQFLLAF